MPRSDPARSDYCATRHLLRHLEDPRELRRNPLVREAFAVRDADAACRATGLRVHAALATMSSQRSLAILLRADVLKHNACEVARDLGLSMRQYHRERRRAHQTFLSAYRSQQTPAAVDEDFAVRTLEAASALADSGYGDSARAVLEDAAGAGGAIACEASIRLATLEIWAHRFDRAHTLLIHADRALAALEGVSGDTRSALADKRRAASLAIAAFSQGPHAVQSSPGAGPETAFACADAAFMDGDTGRARRLLSALPDRGTNAAMKVDAWIMQGEFANFTSQDGKRSAECFEQARALAERAGFRGRSFYAQSHALLNRWMHLRRREERAAYRDLVDDLDPALPARIRMYVLSCAADVELAIGNPARALELAERVLQLARSSYDRLSARALVSAALLRTGKTCEAHEYARLTADDARSAGYPRILALAQRVNAVAAVSERNVRAAREAIEEAVECARSSSSVYVVQHTETLRARIRRAAR